MVPCQLIWAISPQGNSECENDGKPEALGYRYNLLKLELVPEKKNIHTWRILVGEMSWVKWSVIFWVNEYILEFHFGLN